MSLLPFSSQLIADVGISFGDEGKGRLIPEVAEELRGTGTPVSVVLKVNGGANSGHTAGGIKLNLLPAGGRTIPYAVVGGGVYHARFDMDGMFGGLSGRFAPGTMMQPIGGGQAGFGMLGPGYGGHMPGQGFGPAYGAYAGGTFTPPHLPSFYANRFGQMQVPEDGRWGTRSFTDPAMTIGGGLKLDVTDRLFIRPDARALVVFGDGRTNTLGLFSLGVGVRF